MTDHEEPRPDPDVAVDAERFVDDDIETADTEPISLIDLPPDGSVLDIVDQHIEVPLDEEP